jgi:hypothetical protein
MTPEALRKLIESDAEAKKLAEAGAADLCAARCRAIGPRETVETRITELSILAAFPNPADGEKVMVAIETAAKSATGAVIKRALKWLQPGAPGVDVGDSRIRTLLTTPVAQGGVGLTQELAKPLLALAETEPTITGADVSTAWPFGV